MNGTRKTMRTDGRRKVDDDVEYSCDKREIRSITMTTTVTSSSVCRCCTSCSQLVLPFNANFIRLRRLVLSNEIYPFSRCSRELRIYKLTGLDAVVSRINKTLPCIESNYKLKEFLVFEFLRPNCRVGVWIALVFLFLCSIKRGKLLKEV